MTRVHSFAYVTGVTTDYATSVDVGMKVNRCNITARLPLALVETRPKGADAALLEGATLVGERVKDPYENCESYLHTWQKVDFDPAHRDQVHFDWPTGDPSVGNIIIGGVMLVVIAYAIFDRVRDRLRRRARSR